MLTVPTVAPPSWWAGHSINPVRLLVRGDQLTHIRELYGSPKEDPDLRAQLALVLGHLRPTAVQTGARLQDFQPDPPAAPPKKDEKKDKEP